MGQLLSGTGMFILFCIFLILKLTGYIAWSWVWVTAPLWIGFVLFSMFFLFVAIFAAVAHILNK